jgi:hypothetical protein
VALRAGGAALSATFLLGLLVGIAVGFALLLGATAYVLARMALHSTRGPNGARGDPATRLRSPGAQAGPEHETSAGRRSLNQRELERLSAVNAYLAALGDGAPWGRAQ